MNIGNISSRHLSLLSSERNKRFTDSICVRTQIRHVSDTKVGHSQSLCQDTNKFVIVQEGCCSGGYSSRTPLDFGVFSISRTRKLSLKSEELSAFTSEAWII